MPIYFNKIKIIIAMLNFLHMEGAELAIKWRSSLYQLRLIG
jgi:hypothetical protein